MRLLSALLAVAPLLVGADLPSADSLLQQAVERSGGAEAYRNAKNAMLV